MERPWILEFDAIRKHANDDLGTSNFIVAMGDCVDQCLLQGKLRIGGVVAASVAVLNGYGWIQRRDSQPGQRLRNLVGYRPGNALGIGGVAIRFVVLVESEVDVRAWNVEVWLLRE